MLRNYSVVIDTLQEYKVSFFDQMNSAPDRIPDSVSYETLFYYWLNRTFADLEAERQKNQSDSQEG